MPLAAQLNQAQNRWLTNTSLTGRIYQNTDDIFQKKRPFVTAAEDGFKKKRPFSNASAGKFKKKLLG